MKAVVYTSPFVPAEWIAAHGFLPSRRVPARPAADVPEGACPFATAFARDIAATDEPVVVATTCDQMRRTAGEPADPDRPVFLFHVPAADSPAAGRFYLGELIRLGRFLVRHGGTSPGVGRLAAVMAEREAQRARLASWRGRLGASELARRFERFGREGDPGPEPPAGAAAPPGCPVLVLGGPLTPADFVVLDLIEAGGARIAADGTETGERTWPRRFDPHRAASDPLAELADAYFGTIPDVFRRPDDLLHRWGRETVAALDIRGIVAVLHVGCDLWRAAAATLGETAGRPLLTLDLQASGGLGGTATRVQAFLETLR